MFHNNKNVQYNLSHPVQFAIIRATLNKIVKTIKKCLIKTTIISVQKRCDPYFVAKRLSNARRHDNSAPCPRS